MSKEALTLALEALEKAKRQFQYNNIAPHLIYDDAITAIKEALSSPNGEAQPEQRSVSEHLEPVAWMDSDGFPWSKQGIECRTTKDTYTPLYTIPPQHSAIARTWVGLDLDVVAAELRRLYEVNKELLEALKQVTSWIDNWSPEFTYDEDWPADRDAARTAIAKATGGAV